MACKADTLLLRWDDAYSVRISVFDEQHKHLFLLVNRLHASMEAAASDARMRQILAELVVYIMTHFEAEEAALQAFGYPKLSQHIQEHQQLAAAVLDYIKRYRNRKAGFHTALLGFLQSWLTKHILGTDQDYSQFLRNHGLQ